MSLRNRMPEVSLPNYKFLEKDQVQKTLWLGLVRSETSL